MKHALLLIIILISTKIQSQNQFNSESFGVSRNELSTNTYDKDSTANALVIYEHGSSYLDKNTFKLKFEFKQKLKIFNRKGFDKAQIKIYLYKDGSKKESISKITATTYNIENNVVTKTELEENQIFEEKYNDNYTIVKFTFPNIKEGSVVTYSYTFETPYMFKYKGWDFQDDIPKLYSQYETSVPGNYEYNIKLVGFLKFFKKDFKVEKSCLEDGRGNHADCAYTNYIMKDIPAFVEENYMTTKYNYLSRLEYELKTIKGYDGVVTHYTKTWETVDSELKTDKDIGRQLNKNGAVKDLLDEAIVNETNTLKKAKEIYQFVQNTYTWNQEYNIFKDVSIKNLIDKKSGNVSEINILLHNLLDENGIEVKPILLSTRNNGLATTVYPVISDFNYLIVQVSIDGSSYFLDATDKFLTFGQLPFRCLNQYGRLLDFKNGSSWIEINSGETSTKQYRVQIDLDSTGVLIGSTTKKTTGYHALPLKEQFFKNKEVYLKSQKEKNPAIDFTEYTIKTEEQTEFEFIEEFQTTQDAEIVGDKLYINPFLFKFFEENMFKLQERTYPIDFGYNDAYLYTLKLNVSDTYQIVEVPEEKSLNLPNNTGKLVLNTQVEGNTVQIYFKITFNQAIYNPEYYKSIKEFMGKTVDLQKNSLIVIQKK